MTKTVGDLVAEGLQVAQDAVDNEFARRFNLFCHAEEDTKQERFEELLQVEEVSFDVINGLMAHLAIKQLHGFAKQLGELLLTHPERLANQQLQLIIHNLSPVRQQAADILRQRPNLTENDRVYLNPESWEELDKIRKKARSRKTN